MKTNLNTAANININKRFALSVMIGLIFLFITTSSVSADTVCYNDVATIPATCAGGAITQDTSSGSCRSIVCSNNNDSLQIFTCDKPSSIIPDHFEMYKQVQSGTSVSKICLGTACISSNGFASQNFPSCIETSPSINNTDNTTQSNNQTRTNTTSQITVSLNIAP